MKYLIDLKIGDKVWEVYEANITETDVKELSKEVVKTYFDSFKIEKDTSNIADRIINKSGTTLCITLEDACILAKVNCFERLKKEIHIIRNAGANIDAIGERIDELNNFQIK